ncbi:MAG: hypothetical protein IPP90_10255 [Gemmatimonadaceae bacterium]|nr:hypothetical protein [Gemmatimonadaceae bacterium]
MQRSNFALMLGAAAMWTLAACSEGTGPNNHGTVGLGFQVSRTSAAGLTATAAVVTADGSPIVGAAPVVTNTPLGVRITRDADVIVISKAQFVVRDVKLKSATAICTDDDDFAGAAAQNGVRSVDARSQHDRDDADCPSVRVGPFLVDVPMNGTDGARVAVPVPEGTYSSVRLTLHKVTSSDSADAAFRQAFPDFRGISVRLEGTYNGTPFVFVGDVDAKIEVPLTAPVVIKTGGDDVTVSVDLGTWFVRPSGGLLSPALANTPGGTRSTVQNNIRFAFKAFRDRNHDGHED